MTSIILWYVIAAAVLVVPFWKILPRYGISKYFSLMIAIVPAVAVVLLWIIAFKDDIEGI
ncbi:MAG: hypothetical protein QNJ13_14345 [Paracoccaceae bacterium]|nr:hypothetical protein [Paracoccaceae bacterium]